MVAAQSDEDVTTAQNNQTPLVAVSKLLQTPQMHVICDWKSKSCTSLYQMQMLELVSNYSLKLHSLQFGAIASSTRREHM
jgi:hypothetical protein